VNCLIEVNKTFDLLPGIDKKTYGMHAKKVIDTLLKAPGLVEFRANRNVLGSPQVRLTIIWRTLADWAKFDESAERWALDSELLNFATNVRIEIWGPSPVVPEPLRPSK
jgi:heme-degrading monooxygenase HmoA